MSSSESAKYSSKQLDRALKKLNERKKARQKARDEERCYVEYRKQQILSSFQPTVGTLRSGDEAFPKRRRGSMGFGERKAHYLAIRPNARFATWIGRKKGVIEAKPQATPSTAQFTDHSILPEATVRAESPKQGKDKKDSETTARGQGAENSTPAGEKSATTHPAQVKEEHVKKEKRGNRAENPLINGAPFWTIQNGNETDEVTDEDLPVDMDILERVCNGDLTLTQKPFQKTKFTPFGSVHRFKYDDALFARDSTLFTSTVEAVISLQPEEDAIYAAHPPIQHLIKWSDKIQFTHYDPTDREQPIEALAAEDMKDIRREKAAEKK